MLDEIGRFEADSLHFLEGIGSTLDSDKLVLAALKKEPVPFHEKIKARRDVIMYDLDEMDRDKIFTDILLLIKDYKSRKQESGRE